MAILTLCDQNRTFADEQAIRDYLGKLGIDYERWPTSERVACDASEEKILEAYANEIEKLKAAGGYVTADVIDVGPDTPGLEEMLARFAREHWHDEDEVRFIISGNGLFHIHFGVRQPVDAFSSPDSSLQNSGSNSPEGAKREQVAALQNELSEVISIEVSAGDLIRVPRGTLHWFNLCTDRRIRAIRLFQDKSGWTPHYTDSHLDQNYLPDVTVQPAQT
jgi:1,2-dihydroxy-3-keto-5-methylthiopentene dioxygenase